MRLHQARTRRTIVSPRHHAVGIERDHVAVAAAEAPTEVGDVAALALHPHPPAPVEDRGRSRSTARHQSSQASSSSTHGAWDRPCRSARRSRSVASAPVRSSERYIALQAGEHAIDRLVGDRHDDRRARPTIEIRRRLVERPGDAKPIAPRRAGSRSPAIAVQKPIEIQPNSAPKKIDDRRLRATSGPGTAEPGA